MLYTFGKICGVIARAIIDPKPPAKPAPKVQPPKYDIKDPGYTVNDVFTDPAASAKFNEALRKISGRPTDKELAEKLANYLPTKTLTSVTDNHEELLAMNVSNIHEFNELIRRLNEYVQAVRRHRDRYESDGAKYMETLAYSRPMEQALGDVKNCVESLKPIQQLYALGEMSPQAQRSLIAMQYDIAYGIFMKAHSVHCCFGRVRRRHHGWDEPTNF